jgi:16S rRNA (guanine527-N7)-methyltransferase
MYPRGNTRDQGKLAAYEELVRAWAGRLDLVSPGDLARFGSRHIADSLRALDLVQTAPEGPCADVGSGAGLPGIPLAIASGRRWRLLEPRAKRAGFLEEVARSLDLDCEVLRLTAQDAARDPGLAGAHAVATARALAPPKGAVELVMPLVAAGGRAVIFLGRDAELPSGAASWAPGIATIEVPTHPSLPREEQED